MRYLSAKETSKKWNLSVRRVLQYLKDGRIDGAYMMGSTWAIPENAIKPTDPRRKRNLSAFAIKNIIHITGASGSGTTTLGKGISEKWGYTHLDTDAFFWIPTDPPYTTKRPPEERLQLLAEKIAQSEKCVISGSLCGWGDVFIPKFGLVLFVDTPTDIRIARLMAREYNHFGDRIMQGGDMHDDHVEFLEWAARYDTAGMEQRSRTEHMEWLKRMTCPVVTVDGSKPMELILEQIGEAINGKRQNGSHLFKLLKICETTIQ